MNIKKIFLPSFILLLISLTLIFIPTDKEGDIYSDTLRLHILARSDSEEDQGIKLLIRDEVLTEYGEILKGKGFDEAVAIANNSIVEIEDFVNNKLSEIGSCQTASVSIGQEWYDTRVYEDYTLPCGYYTSLKIVLDEGEGKNWWCVMYPPLCLDLASESAPADDAYIDYSKEEINLIKNNGYNVKFKILEIFASVFQK